MGTSFTLDSLREEVEKKYAPIDIVFPDESKVELHSLLRLPKKKRDSVLESLKALEKIEEEDEDAVAEMVKVISSVLTLIADDGPKLLKALDGDLALSMRILEAWLAASQPGEAKNSPA